MAAAATYVEMAKQMRARATLAVLWQSTMFDIDSFRAQVSPFEGRRAGFPDAELDMMRLADASNGPSPL